MIHQTRCQIFSLPEMSDPVRIHQRFWQRHNRLRRILKRRSNYLKKLCLEIVASNQKQSKDAVINSNIESLKPGDIVRVKSPEEIKNTLNHWNMLQGCVFLEEMWPYCGKTQRVFKPVEKFLDERDYLMKKCHGIVILDGVMCQGTKDFGPCDRSCFYFWREEWLEKLS